MSKKIESGGVTITEPKSPECEKMSACREDSQKLGEFIEWLRDTWEPKETELRGGIELGLYDINIEKVLAEYFEIDLDKVEDERRELILYCRMVNEEREKRKELMIE